MQVNSYNDIRYTDKAIFSHLKIDGENSECDRINRFSERSRFCVSQNWRQNLSPEMFQPFAKFRRRPRFDGVANHRLKKYEN